MDMLSWENLTINIFLATCTSESIISESASSIRAISKVLPRITADFHSLHAKYSLVNLYQSNDQGSMLGRESVVSDLLAFGALGYNDDNNVPSSVVALTDGRTDCEPIFFHNRPRL